MSPHFEFLLQERKAGKLYLSTTYYHCEGMSRRRHIWCQSDQCGTEFPPLMNDTDLPMQPGDVDYLTHDDGSYFMRYKRLF